MRVAIALAVLGGAAEARPESCSGDSSSSGSSSSAGDSSEGGSSSEPACVDETDIVGYRKCTRFGRWGDSTRLPRFAIELGMAMRQVAPSLGERTGTVTHEAESFAYRIALPQGTEAAFDHAMVFTARVAAGIGAGLYAGLEGEAGVLAEPRGEAQMMDGGIRGTPTLEAAGRPSVFGALGVVGFRAQVGPFAASVEAAGGARMVTYSYESRYLACETTEHIYATRSVVEGRARLEWWATPFVSVGGSVGGSLLERGALVGGAYIGLHSRAFAGGR